MTVNGIVIKNIIRKLLAAEDHGIEINQLITDEFLKYVVNFLLARGSSLLVGKKISEKMKNEMDDNNILWVELGTEDGYKRFEKVVNSLQTLS